MSHVHVHEFTSQDGLLHSLVLILVVVQHQVTHFRQNIAGKVQLVVAILDRQKKGSGAGDLRSFNVQRFVCFPDAHFVQKRLNLLLGDAVECHRKAYHLREERRFKIPQV